MYISCCSNRSNSTLYSASNVIYASYFDCQLVGQRKLHIQKKILHPSVIVYFLYILPPNLLFSIWSLQSQASTNILLKYISSYIKSGYLSPWLCIFIKIWTNTELNSDQISMIGFQILIEYTCVFFIKSIS